MTYRERREQRAERLHEWAGKRAAKADAAHDRAHEIADQIPFGQPILVGHHSERHARRDQERIEKSMRSAIDNDRAAKRHEERARNIDEQLSRSIYSDDEDALERLEERITELEAERTTVKAYNASCRRGKPDPSLLDDKNRAQLESVVRTSPMFLGKGGAMPAYVLTNLSQNISRQKKRLEELRRDREHGEVPREMFARFSSTCDECGEPIEKGSRILYFRGESRAIHAEHGVSGPAGECPECGRRFHVRYDEAGFGKCPGCGCEVHAEAEASTSAETDV